MGMMHRHFSTRRAEMGVVETATPVIVSEPEKEIVSEGEDIVSEEKPVVEEVKKRTGRRSRK